MTAAQPTPDPNEPIHLGVCGKPHGLRGEVRVNLIRITQDEIQRLETDRLLLIERRNPEPREVRLTGSRFHQQFWLISLEGMEDRTAAESLNGAILAVRRADLWPPDEDEYFELDLIGLKAIDAKTGESLGEVTGLKDGAAHDLLLIRKPGGKTFLVPFVDAMVPEVNLEKQIVRLDLPEGLIDL
ncbi:16S rRNA processing protein RimM [Candidatus Sumerlaeota bacterium]|nr:16S rRNA processing protein RimM [Candidatus Sumerlaeota bacterium]